ncbi:iron-containing redox enzyme family protein [Massilia sp. TSP1-1-2]|uniref:iron-containing redox enzyme family protein n=1 Tax=Massilia sp. TSP1-1-2 TaxID=2804649 RepID=UPI003CFB1595
MLIHCLPDLTTLDPAARTSAAVASSRALYAQLENGPRDDAAAASAAYLNGQLALAEALPCDLPADPAALAGWAAPRSAAVARQYRHYLAERKQGAPRSYFSNRAHALYFLRCAAPTKLVDGAWLFGALRRWHENEFRPLIKTYIEELGDGLPAKNHVVLYQRLLDNHACNDWRGLDDTYFNQGAIQLALAYAGAEYLPDYLPEMVGYNLGYEQLPLHLLITSYELNELGIDPYYFTLHVTVDNAATGHAHDAVDALTRLLANARDPAAFYQRVRAGYRLNELGAGTNAIIAAFDLEAELVRILGDKATVGQDMHGDYCRVAGKTINTWLADSAQIPTLLRAFESTGWIKRGAPAAESRFWRLIQGERAEMFGVFSPYEQQVLSDWIETAEQASATARVASFRARKRALEPLAAPGARSHASHPPRTLIRYPYAGLSGEHAAESDQLRSLERAVAMASTKADAMALLIEQMSPARHHSAAGLMATRMFARLLA